MAFAIKPCCDLPAGCLSPLFDCWQGRPATEPLIPESAPPCSVFVHLLHDLHELRLHLRQRSWRRARHLCGFLVRVFATSEADWLSSTFSPSVVPSCLPLFALKRRLFTRPAGLDLTCGLVCLPVETCTAAFTQVATTSGQLHDPLRREGSSPSERSPSPPSPPPSP